MAPASEPRSSNAGVACLQIAPNANNARGIVRAAAYIANIKDACVGTESTGIRYCGRMIPTMEKPLATRTLIAVNTDASQNAFVVVIDSPLSCQPKCCAPSCDTRAQKHPAQIFQTSS